MAKQAPDTDKGRDTVRDQTRFQHSKKNKRITSYHYIVNKDKLLSL